MNFTDMDEAIKVAAVFEGGKILPKWFIRKNLKYEIKEINFVWDEKQGKEEIINFSITTDSFCAEIAFNKKFLTWYLKKAITE